MLSVRRFEAGDEGLYARIWNKSCKGFSWYARVGPMEEGKAREIIEKKRRQLPAYEILLAAVEGEAVGFIGGIVEGPEVGRILPYCPCVLPGFRGRGVEEALVGAMVEHLCREGAEVVRFSLRGRAEDVSLHLGLYAKLGFRVWRRALEMMRGLDAPLPVREPPAPLRLLTSKNLDLHAFARFFVECYADSPDRRAHLWVDVENGPAISLYKKLGFEETGEALFELEKRLR